VHVPAHEEVLARRLEGDREAVRVIDSVTTMPLNRSGGMGWRTRMRVLYGCPFAVPETKYSSVA